MAGSFQPVAKCPPTPQERDFLQLQILTETRGKVGLLNLSRSNGLVVVSRCGLNFHFSTD